MTSASSLASPWTGAAVLLALALGVACAAYAYATRHFGYWRRKGVPFLRPLPFAGNFKDVLLFRKHMGDLFHDTYTELKDRPYIGMFAFDQPVLLVKDISIWKNMIHRDHEHFGDRGFCPIKSDSLWSESLFARKGKYWKDLRTKLNPTFTVGRLKKFFTLLEQKATNLDCYFDDAANKGTAVDVSDGCARYTMDAVATVGFGIETTALTDDNDPLHRLLRSIFVYSKLYTLASVATFFQVPLLSFLGVKLVPAPLATFLRRTIWGVVAERKRTGVQGARGDFLDVLLELREKGRIAGDDELPSDSALVNGAAPLKDSPMNDASHVNGDAPVNTDGPEANGAVDLDGDAFIAQAFSILAAGFDTTSTTMSFALYHLAIDETMQEKLRTHLQKAVQGTSGKLTYETLQSVDYLDMIFSETLRLYPVLPFLDRVCTKTYRIPNSNVVIDKGVFAYTSTIGIHRDPQYYPNPELFDPERFSEVNKANIPRDCYFPFGAGPHQCMGMRLAYLQGKLGLAHIILNYKLHPCADTPSKMEYNLHSFLISPRNGVPLKLTRVQK